MNISTQNYVAFVLSVILFSVMSTIALADDPTATSVVQPRENDTISDLTMITGSVNFNDFERYEIFLQGGGAMIWAANGFAPMNNGNLARLDPRVFADGSYQIVIRQVRTDSNYTDYAGPIVYIDNPLDAPLPYYPDIEPSFLYALDGKAAVRFRNCSGFDVDLDYHSALASRSGGDLKLMARKEAAICTFEDLALIPGSYEGTIREAGTNGIGYQLQAEGGKVYELTYNGAPAGKFQLVVDIVQGDGMASDSMMAMTSVEVAAPSEHAADMGGTAMDDTVTKAQAVQSEPAVTKGMLPSSGGEMVSATAYLPLVIGVILFVMIGGVIGSLYSRRRMI